VCVIGLNYPWKDATLLVSDDKKGLAGFVAMDFSIDIRVYPCRSLFCISMAAHAVWANEAVERVVA
jgi:hypothetical protein